MPNSSRAFGFALLLVLAGHASRAWAQQQPQGFAVERFYPSAPGGGWFVMDDLDTHGGLDGALELSLGYARNPLRVTDGVNRLAVVSNQAFADIGAAITYHRFRFYLDLDAPFFTSGQSGMVGGYAFTGPSLDWGSNPDPMSDARIGTDVRIAGEPGSRFRFGAGAQLFVPFGNRADYHTDHTFRGMLRALFAGDASCFAYAGQLGVHIRPLDDSPTPGSPQGSELLFGLAAGAKVRAANWAVVVGPEIYGATAFRSFFRSNGTAPEGLLTARFEGALDGELQSRIKLGVGAGLRQPGASQWRLLVAVEIFGQPHPQEIR